MSLDKSQIFKLPWSKTDNPGAWVEVTDICDLNCPGCFRHKLEGHRPLEIIKQEILECKKLTNCSRIAISGGEPLLYPEIIEVVRFIRDQGLSPCMLTNGTKLTPDFVKELRDAGLFQFYFHVDAGQNRPGWEGKTELEMNELRQFYIDMVAKVGKIQSGFNMTIRRSNLNSIGDIVKWYRANISKANHLSLIACRGIPKISNYKYSINGKNIDAKSVPHYYSDQDEINITTDEMYDLMKKEFNNLIPCAYLNGTSNVDTFKFLIMVNIGTDKKIYGQMGPKSMELFQYLHHYFKKTYCAIVPKTGKKILVLSLFDKVIRKALFNFLKASLANPTILFKRFHIQELLLQQPYEIIDGENNMCDGCINMMLYKGKLINSCRLDEYRMFGGPVVIETDSESI